MCAHNIEMHSQVTDHVGSDYIRVTSLNLSLILKVQIMETVGICMRACMFHF